MDLCYGFTSRFLWDPNTCYLAAFELREAQYFPLLTESSQTQPEVTCWLCTAPESCAQRQLHVSTSQGHCTDLVDELSHKPKCCGPLSLTVKNLESRPPPLLPLERQDKETRWAQNTKESGAHPRIDVLQPIKAGQIHSHFWGTEVKARSRGNAWHTFIHVRASHACCKLRV